MIANLAITYRCNSKCTTCNIWQIKNPPELTPMDIKKLFTENHVFLQNVKSIQITGGEPTLHLQLPEIIEIIHETLPECTYWIPTNGQNPEEIRETTETILEKLNEKNLGVTISIDGTPATHDKTRGIRGSYRKATSTLGKLRELRAEYPELSLTVGMTITGDNMNQIKDIYRLSREYDAEFSFRPAHTSEIYYRNQGDTTNISEKFIQEVQDITRDIRKRLGVLKSAPTLNYMQGAVKYMQTGKRELKCTAGSSSIYIDAYGDMYPCLFYTQKLGNIKEDSLETIYRSPQADRVRGKIGKLECLQCWVECEVYREINKIEAVLGSVTSQLSS